MWAPQGSFFVVSEGPTECVVGCVVGLVPRPSKGRPKWFHTVLLRPIWNPTLSVVDGAHFRVGDPATPRDDLEATGRNDDPATMSNRLDGL